MRRGRDGDETERSGESSSGSSLDDRPGSAAFDVTHEELRVTFDYQVGRLQEIDTKAIEILKANLLLIGLVVTGGSILVQTDLEIAAFINPFTVVGGLLLLASTGLAAVTYTASDIRGGLDADAIEAIVSPPSRSIGEERTDHGDNDIVDHDAVDLNERLLRSYAEWIEYNARVTAVNDLLATVTVVSVFVAFVYVIAGVAVGGAGLTTIVMWLTFLALSAAMFGFSYVVVHMDHVDAAPDRSPGTFEGVRISKGGSRRRGTTSLRRMIDPRPSEEDLETEDHGDENESD
ncbi:hypothetical protein J2751_000239 [Halorubrum alkaliphilum]|uniref:Uncharacterized protein n=1 Tax=Halorubrum alkaliphilum TaxID=261290 RepID=A0A8T4GAY2_9EURY|nr:hypothetical protein [Halorubrum alkaliphilum]MBP1921256.1 hypothetical protein [Halorubrum alkaliphilum]